MEQIFQTTVTGNPFYQYTFEFSLVGATTNDGNYSVTVSNAAGVGSTATWTARLALPGMAEAWGSDAEGESDRPATLNDTMAVDTAGDYHSVAVTDSGSIVEWGKFSSDGVTFHSCDELSHHLEFSSPLPLGPITIWP